MKNSIDDIISISFGEFAFLLLFIFMIFSVYETIQKEKMINKDSQRITEEQYNNLKDDILQKESEIVDKENEITKLNKKLKKYQGQEEVNDKLSKQTPTCKELKNKDLTENYFWDNYLFKVYIVGEDQFILNNTREIISFSKLLEKYKKDLNKAEQCGCIHTVSTLFREFKGALRVQNKIERYFYCKKSTIKDFFIVAIDTDRFNLKTSKNNESGLSLNELIKKTKLSKNVFIEFRYMKGISNSRVKEVIRELNKYSIYVEDKGVYGS